MEEPSADSFTRCLWHNRKHLIQVRQIGDCWESSSRYQGWKLQTLIRSADVEMLFYERNQLPGSGNVWKDGRIQATPLAFGLASLELQSFWLLLRCSPFHSEHRFYFLSRRIDKQLQLPRAEIFAEIFSESISCFWHFSNDREGSALTGCLANIAVIFKHGTKKKHSVEYLFSLGISERVSLCDDLFVHSVLSTIQLLFLNPAE